MTEPKTTDEASKIIRRCLYDLAREPAAQSDGSWTRDAILAYATKRRWPVPKAAFDKAIADLTASGAVESSGAVGLSYGPGTGVFVPADYRLTAKGDRDEVEQRTPWRDKFFAELGRPGLVAGIVIGVLGTILTQWLARLLFGPAL